MTRHAHLAQMMRSGAPSVVILEDNFQSGNPGDPLVGRVTPIGGYPYIVGANGSHTPFMLDQTESYYKDGVNDQLGVAEGTVGSASDVRTSHYLPNVLQTNKFRVEFDSFGYQGATIGRYYTFSSIMIGDGTGITTDNGLRVYLYPSNVSKTEYLYIVATLAGSVVTEIDRSSLPITTGQRTAIEIVIERNEGYLYISIDDTVITDGTSYSGVMASSVNANLSLYTRSKEPAPVLAGRIKAIAL